MPLTPKMKKELLSQERIARWLDEHTAHRPEILSAIDKISTHHEIDSVEKAHTPVCSAADAICNGIKIFVSYKIGHGRAAKALLEPLSAFGNGRILFDGKKWPFRCELAGLQGRTYKDDIHLALEETHWFFLLLPDTSIDRSWTMFEAGFFRRSMQFGDRLICIHHSTVKPAGPLEDFGLVVADYDNILSLYKTLLCNPDPMPGMDAIHPRLTDNHLEAYVNDLTAEIQPTPQLKRRYFISYMDIKLDKNNPIIKRDDLLASEIVAGFNIDHIFGSALVPNQQIQDELDVERPHPNKKTTLGEIIGNKESQIEHLEWVDCLTETLSAVFNGKEPEPVDVILQGKDYRFYLPVLQTIRQRSFDGALVSAHISFHEKISGPILRAPRNLEALAAALQLGYRFRWEIIEEFQGIVNKSDVSRIKRILRRMERESRRRSLLRSEATSSDDLRQLPLVRAFRLKQDQDTVITLYEQWNQYRNQQSNGQLDIAFNDRDPDKVASCLEVLGKINRSFMRIGATRLAELVAIHWAAQDDNDVG